MPQFADGPGESLPVRLHHRHPAQWHRSYRDPKDLKECLQMGEVVWFVRKDGSRSRRVQLLPARGKPVGLTLTHDPRNTYLSSSLGVSLLPAEPGQLTSFLELYHQLLNEK